MIKMNRTLYEKLLHSCTDSEKIGLAIFYDKAIGDADIVVRLEHEIAALKLQSYSERRTLPNTERAQLIKDINQLLQILNGDKPDD